MTKTSPADRIQTVFVATEEAMHAEMLRAKRDRTDAQVAHDLYLNHPHPVAINQDRAKETATRGRWEARAMSGAVDSVVYEAMRAGAIKCVDELGEPSSMDSVDLEGASIPVTVSDLAATATLTLASPTPVDS